MQSQNHRNSPSRNNSVLTRRTQRSRCQIQSLLSGFQRLSSSRGPLLRKLPKMSPLSLEMQTRSKNPLPTILTSCPSLLRNLPKPSPPRKVTIQQNRQTPMEMDLDMDLARRSER